MPTASTAAFATWSIPGWATFFLLLTAAVYVRGWRLIRRTRPVLFPSWRLVCFLAGLATVWLAIASPLDSLSNLLLVVHMTQHLLLMSVAPPLVALGAPIVPLLRGLPRSWVREGLGPFFTLPPVHALERLFKSRIFAWLAMNGAFLLWHVPAAYDLALAHPELHEVEHACFLFTSLLFWWPIIQPWPVVYKGSRWMLLPYLMSADIINTALSAFLSFSGRVVYPAYADAPRIFGLTALNDQIAAGSLMWVLGSTAFLIPLMYITVRLVSRRTERRLEARTARANAEREQAELARLYSLPSDVMQGASLAAGTEAGGATTRLRAQVLTAAQGSRPQGVRTRWTSSRIMRPLHGLPKSQRQQRAEGVPAARLDLLAVPAVAAFFKSRYGRPTLQAILLLASTAILVDGFFGHSMGAMNLAGIVPWTYARALFVLALLLVGNLFCMSCPFMLPRELAKKLARAAGFARVQWPRALRGKWLSAALLGLFFWAYEAFSLWDSPARTASLLLAYFLTAITVDSFFRGASFCKYVCPLGQFNFVSSLLSPVELSTRSQSTCASCSTRDCIAGNATQRGCELDLFMPQKSGNLDCTLCMDCVKACPHDNIGLFVQPPARELVQLADYDPQRSSVGRYSRRADVATVALIIIAAAFASAAVMVAPVAALLDRLTAALPGWFAPTAGLALAASAPALLFMLLLAAVGMMRAEAPKEARRGTGTQPSSATQAGTQPRRGADDATLRAQFCRWTLALLPLGLGMWAAHLVFHLVIGWNSIVPALHQAAADLARGVGVHPGAADWSVERALLAPQTLLQLQFLLLDAGLLFALYLGWRLVGGKRMRATGAVPHIGQPTGQTIGQSLARLAPWVTVAVLLYVAGVWVLLEPMQMRGMMGM